VALNTRTSTGLRDAEPSTLPEHDVACLIQVIPTRLTQCPLATVAAPDAPPLSRPLALVQRIDQRKFSGALSGSVTTRKNEPLGRTCVKLVASVVNGEALWRTTRAPYVSADAAAAVAPPAATQPAISATERCLVIVGTSFRLEEWRKMRSFDQRWR
jgi:hypothetical protein